MKKCNKCNDELVVGQNWYASNLKNGTYTCKICWNKKTKKYYKNNPDKRKEYDAKYRLKIGNEKTKAFLNTKKDGYHYVYHIADGNYVGVTSVKQVRKSWHRTQAFRDLSKGTGFQILHKTPCRAEALKVESSLHALGFNG